MLSMVKMLLKGEVGDHALNSHGNYIADHGKSWKNHGIVFLNFCGNPAMAATCTMNCPKLIVSNQIAESISILIMLITMLSLYISCIENSIGF